MLRNIFTGSVRSVRTVIFTESSRADLFLTLSITHVTLAPNTFYIWHFTLSDICGLGWGGGVNLYFSGSWRSKHLEQPSRTGTGSRDDIMGLTCHAKFMQHDLCETAGGKNYCPVAMATPRMPNTSCRGLKHVDLLDFILKTVPAKGATEGWKDGGNTIWNQEKMRNSDTVRKKKRSKLSHKGRRREERHGVSALDNLGHFTHTGLLYSLRKQLICHSILSQHLQAICILPVLPLLSISSHATTFPEW